MKYSVDIETITSVIRTYTVVADSKSEAIQTAIHIAMEEDPADFEHVGYHVRSIDAV